MFYANLRYTFLCYTKWCDDQSFEYGRELGTNELADREKEVAAIIQTVEQGSKLFLVGPRRFGKTSILKTAEDHLIKTGAIVLRFDAESYPSRVKRSMKADSACVSKILSSRDGSAHFVCQRAVLIY
jgi:16S rRNA G1207 methylase RsmC